jgi:hypothetical protein
MDTRALYLRESDLRNAASFACSDPGGSPDRGLRPQTRQEHR